MSINSKLDQKNSNTDTRIRVLHNPFIPKVSQTQSKNDQIIKEQKNQSQDQSQEQKDQLKDFQQNKITEQLQNQYVEQFYKTPHEKPMYRKIKHIEENFFKNATLYYILILSSFFLYWFNREFTIFNYLDSLTSELSLSPFYTILTNNSITKSISTLNQYFRSSQEIPIQINWGQLVSFIVTCLLVVFVLYNFISDKIIQFRRRQEIQKRVFDRLKKSSCQRISGQQFIQITQKTTQEQVGVLLQSQAYIENSVRKQKLQESLYASGKTKTQMPYQNWQAQESTEGLSGEVQDLDDGEQLESCFEQADRELAQERKIIDNFRRE